MLVQRRLDSNQIIMWCVCVCVVCRPENRPGAVGNLSSRTFSLGSQDHLDRLVLSCNLINDVFKAEAFTTLYYPSLKIV